MLRNSFQILFVLFAAVFLFAGCGHEVEPELEFLDNASSGSGVEIRKSGSTLYLNFPSSASSATVELEASQEWAASFLNDRSVGWCSASKLSGGKGVASITVSVKENPDYDDRSASILFESGNLKRTIVVTQKQKEAMLISGKRFDVAQEGGTVQVEVGANVSFSYTVGEGCSSWITPARTKSLSTSTVSFDVAENTTLAKREGEITFTASTGSETVKIYQDGETPTIIVSQNRYDLEAEKASFTVEVRSNIDVSFSVPEQNGWIREVRTKSFSTNSFTFEVDENEEFASRSCAITFSSKEWGKEEKVIVSQKAATPQLILGTGEYTFSYEGGNLDITLKSNMNVGYKIADDCEWIHPARTKALIDKTFHFIVDLNESFTGRETVIVFSNDELGIRDNVTVRQQSEEPALILGTREYTFSYEGGSLDITLKSNLHVDYKIADDCEWIHPARTKALTDKTFHFIVDLNDTFAGRETVIVFSNDELGIRDDVTVRQQSEEPALILGTGEYTFSYEGGDLDITLKSNMSVGYKIADNCKWIHPVGTKTLTEKTFHFIVDFNETFAAREAVIVFSNDELDIRDNVIVRQQSEAPVLIVGDKEFSFPAEGGPLTVKLKSNMDLEVVMSPGCDWIVSNKTKAVTDREYAFTVTENPTRAERSAEIVFRNAALACSDTVRVSQEKKTILASNDILYASRHGWTVFIETVGADPSVYRISPRENWLAVTGREKTASGSRIKVFVGESSLRDMREGRVYVYPDDHSDPDTVVVRQYGILPEFSYTTSSSKTVVPEVEGDKVEGFVFWGDDLTDTYSKGLSHSFSSAGEHTVTVEVMSKKRVPFKPENGLKLNLRGLRNQ